MSKAPAPRPVVLVMGVSGSGKTTIGRLLSRALGVVFIDADDLHPAANVAKMAAGIPLTDEDRWPWLDIVRVEMQKAMDRSEGLVIACSALKRSYRNRLVRPGEPVHVVFLSGPPAVIAARLDERSGHFMPPELLRSQFETLEPPGNATTDDAMTIDVRQSPDELVTQIVEWLERQA